MSDCSLAHSDASYVLGALSAADRLEFERHLSTCESCHRSVADLAGLPGLLGRVPVEQVETPPAVEPVPPSVLPALVDTVRREQRRKNVLITLGAAAAVAVLALGANALQSTRDDGATPVATPSVSSGVSPSGSASVSASVSAPVSLEVVGQDWGMRADVTLTPARGGTKVAVTCSYAERESDYGGHAYRYKLVVFSRGHDPEVASNWKARPGEPISTWGSTAADIDEITRLEVQNDEGKVLLSKEL